MTRHIPPESLNQPIRESVCMETDSPEPITPAADYDWTMDGRQD